MRLSLEKYVNFIFDFDGVIVDSVDIKTEAFAELYQPFGKEVAKKVVAHHLKHGGVDRFSKIRHYHKEYLDYNLSEAKVNALAKKFSGLVFCRVIKAPFIKGALNFIKTLSKKQKKIFLISATPENEIRKIAKMRKIDNYFLEIKGAPFTKKENLSFLRKKYKLEPHNSVYFGDSRQDLDAAESFDIRFVAINYFSGKRGYKDFSELIQSCTV